MDGQCQDEYVHFADTCLEQERINGTFRWIKQPVAFCFFFFWTRVMCSLWCVWERGGREEGSWCFWRFCLRGEYWLCWSTPSRSETLGYACVRVARHARWADVGGGIFFVVFWEFTGFTLKTLAKIRVVVIESSLRKDYLRLQQKWTEEIGKLFSDVALSVENTPTLHPQSTRRTYFHSSLQHVSCSQCLCSLSSSVHAVLHRPHVHFGSRKRIASHGSGAQDSDGRRKP